MSAESDFTELGFRVSKLRVSLRVRQSERRLLPEATEIPSDAPDPTHRVACGLPSTTLTDSSPAEPARHFRCRVSSTSSVTSVDSGIALTRSRANSTSSSSSSRSAQILRKIARAALPVGTENAGFEFEGFYHPAVSRNPSSASSMHSSVSRTSSTSSSVSRTPSSTKKPLARSSSKGRGRILSDDSSDYSDLYTTIEELSDPFKDEEKPAPPPLPPRKARLRTPALPPYPSTAVRRVNNITSTILC